MAKRTLITYRTYSFKEKDPIIDQLKTILADEKLSYQRVHELTGVSVSTLYGWFYGSTKRPQHATAMAVVRGAGWDYKLVRVGKVLQLKRGA